MKEFFASCPEHSHPEMKADVSVLEMDIDAGHDSGLVAVSLRNASTLTYIQPITDSGVPRWIVTFESRSESFDLDAVGVTRLAEDLAAIGRLCTYLQQKTDEAVAQRATAQV
ncbi:hypothetical protein FBY39_0547 [Microbacterium sp. SLBN-146]|nr:hypothetical protein FBY39_0547 [Microbacterium sp. SLBN-146]